jgi:hypothetical protein
MKVPISHVPSVYPYDPLQLGMSVPYLHSKSVPYLIDEKQIIIDSHDRNITIYKNPYNMVIDIDPKIKTVKYVTIDNIVLPYLYELIAEPQSVGSYSTLISAIDASANVLSKDMETTIGGKTIQICNYTIDGIYWDINYTENRDNTTVFNINKRNNTVIKYYIGSSYISNKVIFLQVNEIKANLVSTSSLDNNTIQLYPKKIIADSLWFKIKRDSIVLKNNEVMTVSKLSIRFIDDNNVTLQVYNLDYTTTTDKYNTNTYSSPKYYIRHPLYPKWQVHLVLKLGVIEPFIKKDLF